MVMFTAGGQLAGGGGAAGTGGRVPFPPPGTVPPNDRHPRRQARHLLSGDEQHRLRDRQRQPGRRRHPLPRRPARLPHPHGLPRRVRPRRPHRDRQRGRGPALLRRPLRHPDRQHVALLAVHADRLRLRRAARGRDPRAHGGADPHPRHVPQPPRGRRHRSALLRSALGQGQPLRERVASRGRDQQREEPLHRGRLRERRLRERAGVRPIPRERQDAGGRGRRSTG